MASTEGVGRNTGNWQEQVHSEQRFRFAVRVKNFFGSILSGVKRQEPNPSSERVSSATIRHYDPSAEGRERLVQQVDDLVKRALSRDAGQAVAALRELSSLEQIPPNTREEATQHLLDGLHRMPAAVRAAAITFALGGGEDEQQRTLDHLCRDLAKGTEYFGERLSMSTEVAEGPANAALTLQGLLLREAASDAKAQAFPGIMHLALNYQSLRGKKPTDDRHALLVLIVSSRKHLGAHAFTRLLEAISTQGREGRSVAKSGLTKHARHLVPSIVLDELKLETHDAGETGRLWSELNNHGSKWDLAAPTHADQLSFTDAWLLADRARHQPPEQAREAVQRLAGASMPDLARQHAAKILVRNFAALADVVKPAVVAFALQRAADAAKEMIRALCIQASSHGRPQAMQPQGIELLDAIAHGPNGKLTLAAILRDTACTRPEAVCPGLMELALNSQHLGPNAKNKEAFEEVLIDCQQYLRPDALTRVLESLAVSSPPGASLCKQMVDRLGDKLAPSEILDELRSGQTWNPGRAHQRWVVLSGCVDNASYNPWASSARRPLLK